jgi:uncharacterized protein (TIGR02453 family)
MEMKSTFTGFSEKMLWFFRELRENNDRDWFEAHRDVYLECVKGPMEDLTARVMAEVSLFAPDFAGAPKKAIFRIYRDTRFSNDKTPYKTHTGALLRHPGLPKNEGAGFYFAVSDKNVEVAGGSYMAGPEQMRLVRAHIAANAKQFEKLVNSRSVVSSAGSLQGEALSRPPKGYSVDTPGVEYLKMKQWYHYIELDPKLALSGDVVDEVVSRFKRTLPLIQFLNQPLLAKAKKNAPLTTGWV